MLVYVATYPRCGNSFLRNTMLANWPFEFHPQADREAMAASDQLFLVKTHDRPPASFIEGEKAVQLVRHPSAAITSQWTLKGKFGAKPRPLSDFIAGCGAGGRWDDYHADWSRPGIPLWRWRYEDAFVDPVAMIESLGQFLGFPPAPPIMFTLDEAHAANPQRNPGRGIDGWREQVTPAEAARIWNEHGAAASQFGYSFESAAMMRA